MKILVTVGSTEFSSLVNVFLDDQIQNKLKKHQIVIQYGTIKPENCPERYEIFDKTTEFEKYLQEADMIVSTASAGIRLDSLKYQKPHLMVCNNTLAGNHQMEMINANKQNKSCRVFESPDNLLQYLQTSDLDAEAAVMRENLRPNALNPQDFKLLYEETYKKKHQNKLTFMLFFQIIAVGVTAGIIYLLNKSEK